MARCAPSTCSRRCCTAARIPSQIKDGPITLYRTTGTPGRIVNTMSVSLDGTSWTVTAWPSPALLQQLESTFPIIVLGAGLLTGLLVAMMVGFAQTAAQRAEEARRAKLVTEQHSRRMHIQSQQLALARDAAITATSAKSQFLATMSHEIRTPMNGVLGTLSLLQDTPLSGEQREYVGQIQASADTLLRLIDDILDFSKAEAGRLTIEEAELDLRALVEDAADLMAASAQRKGLEFAVSVDADVPNHLRGDGVRAAAGAAQSVEQRDQVHERRRDHVDGLARHGVAAGRRKA